MERETQGVYLLATPHQPKAEPTFPAADKRVEASRDKSDSLASHWLPNLPAAHSPGKVETRAWGQRNVWGELEMLLGRQPKDSQPKASPSLGWLGAAQGVSTTNGN